MKATNYMKVILVSFQIDQYTYEDTRGRLAIQLINSALNQNRDKLLELSNAQFAIHAVMVNHVSSQVQKPFHQQSGNIRKKKKVNTRTRA